MTKETIRQSLKQAGADRAFIAVVIFLILVGIIYATLIGFSIHPRDVQIYTRYTAFGEAHFYKSPWQYTLLFVAFGVLATFAHAILMIKLHSLGRRQSGLMVGWIGVAVLVMAAIFILSILGYAFQ